MNHRPIVRILRRCDTATRHILRMSSLLVAILFWGVAGISAAHAEQGLQNCVEQFPGSDPGNAPTLAGTAPETPGDGNIHICKRWGETSFFAIEYDETKYTAIWAAYRIGDTFGENGCTSMTRREMQCYFGKDDVDACIADRGIGTSDPFHAEAMLRTLGLQRLGTGAFANTGHDRGHVAPNNTFSWHVCGAFKTFTMANMAAQWGSHNREIWNQLESQILFWGVTDGPIHVVTGPIWTAFPSDEFEAIRTGLVDTDLFATEGDLLTKLDGTGAAGDIPVPPGFFKVVYRPGAADEPDRAVAFLIPHTREPGLSFWRFVSTVNLVEEASGLTFGFDDRLKAGRGQTYWLSGTRRAGSGWDLRGDCDQRSQVAGWQPELSRTERRALCTRSTGN